MASPFYFETLLTTALTGINGGGVTATMSHVGEGIIVATVLYQVYETWWRGADYNELGTVLIKGMLMTTLLANWNTVFHLGMDAFNTVANTIMSHTGGGGDLVKQWIQQAQTEWNNNSASQALWSLAKGGISAAITAILLDISYIALALACDFLVAVPSRGCRSIWARTFGLCPLSKWQPGPVHKGIREGIRDVGHVAGAVCAFFESDGSHQYEHGGSGRECEWVLGLSEWPRTYVADRDCQLGSRNRCRANTGVGRFHYRRGRRRRDRPRCQKRCGSGQRIWKR